MYKIVNFSMQVIIRVVLWHLQSSQVKQTPQNSTNELIIREENPLVVVDFRFISQFLNA